MTVAPVETNGFDWSHHQGDVDPAALDQTYLIELAFCKATEGVSFFDPKFKQNWTRLRPLVESGEVVRGPYHFARPLNDPLLSAERFLNFVDSAGGWLPSDIPVCDAEVSDGVGQDDYNAWLRVWHQHVYDLLGRGSGLYAGRAYMENRTGAGLADVFELWWYPRYPSAYADQAVFPTDFDPTLPSPNTSGWDRPHVWQYSATFPTAQGTFDANVSWLTQDELGVLMAAVDLTPDAIDAVARKVLTLDGVIRDTTVTDPASPSYHRTLASFISDIEATQDGHTILLKGVDTNVKAIILKLADPVVVASLSTEALAAVAKAVNDELGKRTGGTP